jgi:hypothetical protein
MRRERDQCLLCHSQACSSFSRAMSSRAVDHDSRATNYLTRLRVSPPRPVLRGGSKVDYFEGVAMGIVDPVVSCADPISIGIIKC